MLGRGEPETPLVLDRERLYLYRYWRFECDLAVFLSRRSEALDTDRVAMKASLQRLFPSVDGAAAPDWQKVAAAVAVSRRFAVISGGPGTGKTTTVIKLLALHIEQQLALGVKPRIRLAAPTGKAAARMAESIAAARGRLALPAPVAGLIPDEASTLHRLLGVLPGSRRFRHGPDNPLHLDLLVVDEASMVDLPLMARLLSALPESARLVLIGDRDQLASVEAGSVLGDICSWPGSCATVLPRVSTWRRSASSSRKPWVTRQRCRWPMAWRNCVPATVLAPTAVSGGWRGRSMTVMTRRSGRSGSGGTGISPGGGSTMVIIRGWSTAVSRATVTICRPWRVALRRPRCWPPSTASSCSARCARAPMVWPG
ncbi:AAA family ATPase [Marinobacterium aestuariivivens]|uniref:AAA family ATPase n=1 Tax=Marinobacterium aestuariivivens TaxID=1698799 RepID=A0ABW1ZVB6_9GAMM